MQHIRNNEFTSIEFDHSLNFVMKEEDKSMVLRVISPRSGLNIAFNNLYKVSEEVVRNLEIIKERDLLEALRKIYVATMHYKFEKLRKEHEDLQIKMDFVKKYLFTK